MINVFQIEWAPDNTFTPLWTSDNIHDLYPYDAEDFEQKKKNILDFIHPDDLELYKREHLSFLSSKAKENGQPFTHTPFRTFTSDKRMNHFIEQKSFITKEDGEVRIQSLWVDQTQIYKEKERLELVLEGTGLGFWDWNPQTNDVTFDAAWAEMLGYQIEEIEFNLETWSSKVHPEDIESCFADIKDHMEGKTPYYRNIHRMKHKNGHWVYIWDRGKIVEWDSEGKPIRFTGTHTDISKQQLAEQELVRQIKAKESFFALMSHEIRTPLVSLMGFSDLLKEDASLSKESRDYVERIESSSKDLSILVNDILDYSKLISGKTPLFEETFNVRDFTQKLVNQITGMAKNTCDVESEVDESLPELLLGDVFKIKQVLNNFLSNAIKFCNKGKVRLSLSQKNEYVFMSVEDNGIGIGDSELENIFKPFVQESDGTTRKFGGTGLGLSICKMNADVMNGEVLVKSEKGKGSCFTLKIPLKHGAEKPKDVKKNADNKKVKIVNGLKGMKILLVEDNNVNQQLISKFLKNFGCIVDLAKNGKEAVEKSVNNDYDVALMDLMMPVMGGLEATGKILESKPNFKIIGLSANAFDEDREKALAVGMVDFASKPITKEALFTKLEPFNTSN